MRAIRRVAATRGTRFFELRVTSYRLRVAGCELQVASNELRVTSEELEIAGLEVLQRVTCNP